MCVEMARQPYAVASLLAITFVTVIETFPLMLDRPSEVVLKASFSFPFTAIESNDTLWHDRCLRRTVPL